jgi:hypothetical protein
MRAWKAAIKEATKAAPAPCRRRGDGRADFRRAARKVFRVRPVAQPSEAAAYLLDTLDWFNLWRGNDAADALDGDDNHTANPFLASHL